MKEKPPLSVSVSAWGMVLPLAIGFIEADSLWKERRPAVPHGRWSRRRKPAAPRWQAQPRPPVSVWREDFGRWR